MSSRNFMDQRNPVMRRISLTLVVLMLFTSMPVGAFAQNELGGIPTVAESPSPSSPPPAESTTPPPPPTDSNTPSPSPSDSPPPSPSWSPSPSDNPGTPTPRPVIAPKVSTGGASDVQPTSATLNGSITDDGGGDIIDAGFSWYSSKGSGQTHTGSSLTTTITGLSENTTYTFVAFATNKAGTSYGGYQSFTTPISPLIVTTLEAADVGFDKATLKATVTGGGTLIASGFRVTSPSFKSYSATPGSDGSMQITINGLKPGVTYSFTASATNDKGIFYGSSMNFTTLKIIPKVDTLAPSDIGMTTVNLNGSVLDKGSSDITESGFLWGFDSKPNSKVISGHGNAEFNNILKNLKPETTYYFQAYAANSEGIGYGPVLSFKTLNGKPQVETRDADGITPAGANLEGCITNGDLLKNQGLPVTSSGFLWGTNTNPDKKVIVNPGADYKALTYALKGLKPNTTYYYKSFAVNTSGTSYGAVKSFKTLKGEPVVVSWDASSVTAVGANLGADISNGPLLKNLGMPVTDSGFIWGTNPKPDKKVSVRPGADLTSLEYSLKGLKPNTTYYFQAYATNSAGTGYSDVFSFTTAKGLPEVTTLPAEIISPISAIVEGNISNAQGLKNQGLAVTDSGFLWGTDPKLDQNVSVDPDSTGERLYYTFNNLKDDTTYYFQAYAVNSVGTSYGEVISFTTPNGDPEVKTIQVFDVNPVGASLNGFIEKNKGLPITDSGFFIGTDPKPDRKVSCDPETDGRTLISKVNDLKDDTTYYVQAYATNAAGTGYGEVLSFTTTNGDPIVVAFPAFNITPVAAMIEGNVNDKGLEIIDSGFLWGTDEKPETKVSGLNSSVNDIIFSLKGLKEDTTYYFQAYATNVAGTGYSEVLSFMTPNGDPIVETQDTDWLDPTNARLSGSVKDNKGLDILEAGFMWGIDEKPDQKIASDSDIHANPYTALLKELKPNTTYYFQAYAVNEAGTGYGEVKKFTTATYAPLVETRDSGNITSVSANLNGFVEEDYGFEITESGFFWGTDPKPDTKQVSPLPGDAKTFSCLLDKLRGDTTYYIQAYAMNKEGIGFGKVVSFKTSPSIKPKVSTLAADFDSENWQPVLKGNITSNGGDPVTSYGFRYSPDQKNWTNYPVGEDDFSGDFTAIVTGSDKLPVGTYYVQAFAANSVGTSYGTSVKFTTPLPPSVTCSASIPAVGATSAVLTGNITDPGWNGVPCDMRQFQYRKTGTTEWQFAGMEQGSFGAGTFTMTLEGLEPGASYEFRAQAQNPAGLGSSTTVTFTAGWGQDDGEAAKNMKSTGYSGVKIAGILHDVYKDTADAAFGALLYASFEINDIASTLKASVYRTTYQEAISLMKGLGYEVLAVSGMLQKVYPKEIKDLADGYWDYEKLGIGTAQCLKSAGYGIDDIVSVLRTLFNYSVDACYKKLGPTGIFTFDEVYGALIRSFGGSDVAGYIWNTTYKSQLFWLPQGKIPLLSEIAKKLKTNGKLTALDVAQAYKAVYPGIRMDEMAGGLATAGYDIKVVGEAVIQFFGNDVQALAKGLLTYTRFTPSAIEDYLIKDKNASAVDMVKVICNVFNNNFRDYEEIPRVLDVYYKMDAGQAAEAMYSAGYSLDYLVKVMIDYYHLTTPGGMLDIFGRIGLSPWQVIERANGLYNVRNDWLTAFRLHGFSTADYCSYVKANPAKIYGPYATEVQNNQTGFKAQAGSAFVDLVKAGYGPDDIAIAVKNIYSFNQPTMLNIFADVNRRSGLNLKAGDIVAAVDKAYGADSILTAIKSMKDEGSSAVQAALTLKESYGITDPEKAADYLAQAGFNESGVLDGLEVAYYNKATGKDTINKLYQTDQRVFSQSSIRPAIDAVLRAAGRWTDLVRLLNEDGYSIKDISVILKNDYSLTSSQIIDSLVSALGSGRQTDIAAGVSSIFTDDIIPGYIQILKNRKYYASEALTCLTGMFGITDPVTVATYLNQAGYPENEVMDTLAYHMLKDKGKPDQMKILSDVTQTVYNRKPGDLSAIFIVYRATNPTQIVGVLQECGYSLVETMKVLMQSIGLSPDKAIEALKQCGYKDKDIIPALQAVYAGDNILIEIIKASRATYPSQAVTVLKDDGYALADILGAIRDYFGLASDQAIDALRQCGYLDTDIIPAIQAEYGGNNILTDIIKASHVTYPSQAIEILKKDGYSLADITRAVKDYFGTTSDQAIDALRQNGYQDKDIVPAIQTVYGGTNILTDIIKASRSSYPSQAIEVLKNDGYALTDIIRAIKDYFGLTSAQAIDALKQGGYQDKDILQQVQAVYAGDYVLAYIRYWQNMGNNTANSVFDALKRDLGIQDPVKRFLYLRSVGYADDTIWEAVTFYARDDVFKVIMSIYAPADPVSMARKFKEITPVLRLSGMLGLIQGLRESFPGVGNIEIVKALKAAGYNIDDITGWLRTYVEDGKKDDALASILGTAHPEDLGLRTVDAAEILYYKGYSLQESTAWMLKNNYKWEDFFAFQVNNYCKQYPDAGAVVRELKGIYSIDDLAKGVLGYYMYMGGENSPSEFDFAWVYTHLRNAGYGVEETVRTIVKMGATGVSSLISTMYCESIDIANANHNQNLRYTAYFIANTLYTIGLTTPGVSFSLRDIARGLVQCGPNAGGFAFFSKLEIYYAMTQISGQYLAAHGSDAPANITALYLLREGGLSASDAAATLADDGVGLGTGDIIKSIFGIGNAWFDAVTDLYGAGYSFSDSISAVYSNPDYHLVIGVSILSTLATKAVTWLDDTGRVGDIIKAIKKVADLGFKVGGM